MIAVSYLMKRKIKKIYFEVISNTKFLYNEVANDQVFVKLTGEKTKGNYTASNKVHFSLKGLL